MDVIDWLLDSDPSIRWQALDALTDASPDEVAAERARVADEGWGAKLLGMADEDGLWDGGAFIPGFVYRAYMAGETPPPVEGQYWTTTMWALTQLRDYGIDPRDQRVKDAVELVRKNGRWEHDQQPFFEGEVEPCINGRALAVGAYFGQDVTGIADRLLGEQMADGGWNCEQENGSTRGSFRSTIDVLEGLVEYDRRVGDRPAIGAAVHRAHEYLLERHLLRRLTTGEVIDEGYTLFAYPPRSYYDVLRALDHLRFAGAEPDERWDEAVEIVRSKQQPDGRWLLDRTYPGPVSFEMEQAGERSRWNTLRALRVLKYVDARPL